MEKIKKTGWIVIKKYFKGGSKEYALRITKKIQSRFGDWESLLSFIGENTDGGHNYGYRIDSDYVKKVPKNIKKIIINMENKLMFGD